MASPEDRLELGEFEIHRLTDGFFRVDGGAMFGVVPRTLWEKRAVPDGENRITLALNCYLLRSRETTILLETGVGPDVDRRFADFYALDRKEGLAEEFERVSVRPEDVDIVLNSHLHFDHCGGNTLRSGEKTWRPAFPNARYVVQGGEWKQALSPVGRDKPSYIPERLRCLETCGCLDLVEGDVEIARGVRTVLTPGHTGFHQGVKATSGSETFFYFGDTIPTAAHIDLPYIMSFDLYPVETFETKKKLCREAAEEGWIVAFSHDTRNPFGTIRDGGPRIQFTPLAP